MFCNYFVPEICIKGDDQDICTTILAARADALNMKLLDFFFSCYHGFRTDLKGQMSSSTFNNVFPCTRRANDSLTYRLILMNKLNN